MKRAVVYCRISKDALGDGLGVERQEEDCRKLATQMGYEVVKVYVDNDISAAGAVVKKERPEWTAMLAGAAAGEFDVIVAYSNSRLTRRPAEWMGLIHLANAGKIEIATVASGQHDLTTADGRAVAITVAAWDAAEAERVGERVARAAKQRAEKGIPQKGRHRMFGYTRDWEPVEEEKEVIIECFTRRAAGESTTAIANDLAKRGIFTVAGNPWKSGTLGVTLTKHVYCGLRTYKGEVIGPSAVPALVSKELFDAAQKEIAGDKKGHNTRRYLLSGIMLCSKCLSPCKGNPANKMYRCSTTYGGCGKLSVRIALADDYVWHKAMERYAMTVGNAKTINSVDYKTDITTVEAEIKRIQEGFQGGLYTLQEANPLIKARREVLKDLEKKSAKQSMSMPKIQRQYLDWYKMNLSARRAFIGAYITNVVLYPALSRGNQPFNPERMEAHYPDGTKEKIEAYNDYDPAVDD